MIADEDRELLASLDAKAGEPGVRAEYMGTMFRILSDMFADLDLSVVFMSDDHDEPGYLESTTHDAWISLRHVHAEMHGVDPYDEDAQP